MNKKGFTLIEIIGAIIILGIIALIAFNAYTSSMKGFREDYYTDLTRTLRESGKEFFNDNRKYRPNGILEAQKITVNGLMTEKYIDPVVDYNGESCDINTSYVLVVKEGKDKYTYHTCLVCSEDEYDNMSDTYCDASWTDPTRIRYGLGGEELPAVYIYKGTTKDDLRDLLELEISYERLDYEERVIASAKGDGKDSLPTVFPVDMDVVDTNKIGTYTVKYEYSPLKVDGSGNVEKQTKTRKVVVYENESPGINISYENKVADTSLDLGSLPTNNKNGTSSNVKTETGVYTSGTWAQRITISISGSAIEIPEPGVTISRYQWNKDGVWQDFCVTDNNCTVEIASDMNQEIKFRMVSSNGRISKETEPIIIRRDYSPPTCTLLLSGRKGNGVESDWYVEDVGISFASKQEGSGGVESAKSGIKINNIFRGNTKVNRTNSNTENSHSADGTGIMYVGYVEDNAGNFVTCRKTFKRDATVPTCTNSGDRPKDSYTKSAVTITWGCSDETSKCDPDRSGGSHKYTTTIKTSQISAYDIYDKAGNKTTCPARTANVFVDTTAPSCGTEGYSYSGTDGVKATIGCSDSHSGCVQATYTSALVTSSNTLTISDKVGNSKICSYTVCTVRQQQTGYANTCTKSCCGTSTVCSTQGPECKSSSAPGAGWSCTHIPYTTPTCGGGQETYWCTKKTCRDYSKTCTSGSCCGYTWSGWSDVASCSPSATKNCQTVYRAGNGCGQTQHNIFTAYFDGNGGDGTVAAITCTATNGNSCNINLPANGYTRVGHDFKGWATDSSATTGTSPNTQITLTSDVFYFAAWKSNSVSYKVTFNANGGSGTTNAVSCSAGINEYETETSCTVELPANGFTKTGYSFGMWSESASNYDSYYLPGNSMDLTFNKILYAYWMANQYTVTLNGNGATSAGSTSTTATYDTTTLATITRPQRKYTVSFDKNGTGATATLDDKTSTYKFNGWFTAASDGTMVASTDKTPALQASVSGYTDANSKWTKAGNATLYAQWTSKSVTLPTITKTGAECVWNTKSDGSGTSYNGGASFTPTKNITLYAKCTMVVLAEITCTNKPYTGAPQTIATCDGGTIANATQTNAGDYQITCTGDATHADATPKTCKVIPRTPTITCSKPTYTGGTVTIATCANGTITQNATGTTATEYTVTCTGTGNYGGTATANCRICTSWEKNPCYKATGCTSSNYNTRMRPSDFTISSSATLEHGMCFQAGGYCYLYVGAHSYNKYSGNTFSQMCPWGEGATTETGHYGDYNYHYQEYGAAWHPVVIDNKCWYGAYDKQTSAGPRDGC